MCGGVSHWCCPGTMNLSHSRYEMREESGPLEQSCDIHDEVDDWMAVVLTREANHLDEE